MCTEVAINRSASGGIACVGMIYSQLNDLRPTNLSVGSVGSVGPMSEYQYQHVAYAVLNTPLFGVQWELIGPSFE